MSGTVHDGPTASTVPAVGDLHAKVANDLERARQRTLALLEPLDDRQLTRQVSPLMSPLVWDLAHIGHYEELWLLRALADAPPTDPRFDDLYDAFRHPRRERAALPILGPAAARAFVADVRARSLEQLARTELHDGRIDGDDPLLAGGFVYGMVVQHEHQHDETMLATIDLMGDVGYPFPEALGLAVPAARTDRSDDVDVPAGEFLMGTDSEPWAYDNERPAHRVTTAPFRIDRRPVTNARFAEFVADGGYDDARLWSDTGWAWRTEAGLEHPQGWSPAGGGTWALTRFGRRQDLPSWAPVEHVCWYEADAFARWDGGRLPTEAEWEHAASLGVLEGTGRVWEWTASDFGPYPAFRSFPYREYSEVFFGEEYKVLRGGSWASDPVAVRPTFRNWDFPIRRQIFSGFRCARDDG